MLTILKTFGGFLSFPLFPVSRLVAGCIFICDPPQPLQERQSAATRLCQLWLNSGPTLARVWLNSGSSLAQLWSNAGSSLAQLWFKSGSTPFDPGSGLTQVWLSSASTLAQDWPKSGPGLVQLYLNSGCALACFRHKRMEKGFPISLKKQTRCTEIQCAVGFAKKTVGFFDLKFVPFSNVTVIFLG